MTVTTVDYFIMISCFAACAINILFALFLWVKNPRDIVARNLKLSILFTAVYGLGVGGEYFCYYYLPRLSNFAARVSLSSILSIPPYVVFSYYLSGNLKNIRLKKIIIYALTITLVTLIFTTDLMVVTVKDWHHLKPDDPPAGPLEPLVRLFILASLTVATYNLLKGFRKTTGFRRVQLKYFIWGIFVYIFFTIILSAIIPLVFQNDQFAQLPPVISIIMTGTATFAIIRYRLMDIETVVHKTILWVLTSLLIILPVYFFWKFFQPLLSRATDIFLSLVMLFWFLIYGWYNKNIQPGIDHLFRRRKYDYYNMLRELGQKIGTELELNSVLSRLFRELQNVLYIRNVLILVRSADREDRDFYEVGQAGYDQSFLKSQEKVLLKEKSGLYHWIMQKKKAVEKGQIMFDPQYREIKEESLLFYYHHNLELLVPLILEAKVIGVMRLGKKENLQGYTLMDTDLLEQLCHRIGVTIDNALHHSDIVEKERLEEALKLGQKIQLTLLPSEVPRIKGLNVYGFMTPAREIGGDYFDFIAMPEKKSLAIVIGDISGKGVGAGLYMVMLKTAVHIFSKKEQSPRQVILDVNRVFNRQIEGEKFMTLLYLLWQEEDATLTYSSGAHEHILVYRDAAREVETIPSGGILLGVLPDINSYIEEKSIKLKPRDKILLYTDGVTEAHNSK
ncbi:MAG: SpoIIE family protein phosphatase, partial [bacterium]|nr:SpoIIE family protein phosphatase [bacterium]